MKPTIFAALVSAVAAACRGVVWPFRSHTSVRAPTWIDIYIYIFYIYIYVYIFTHLYGLPPGKSSSLVGTFQVARIFLILKKSPQVKVLHRVWSRQRRWREAKSPRFQVSRSCSRPQPVSVVHSLVSYCLIV